MRKRDFRIICDCQRHKVRREAWRRTRGAAATAAGVLRRGSVALLIGVPLAFGAVGIPIDAMNTSRTSQPPQRAFHVFTTQKVRREFLSRPMQPRELTLDIAKEEFFRTAVPYGPIIYREARRNALPPELVAAVVEAESDFRVRLVSGKNAQGLMQIVPSTGEILGAGDLFNPDQNIAAGTKYLRYLVDRFHDPLIALAAYNAGEGNVAKWGGVPPFAETQAYINRVNQHARFYRARIRQAYLTAMRAQASSSQVPVLETAY